LVQHHIKFIKFNTSIYMVRLPANTCN